MSYFQRLGLPSGFDIDLSELERHYLGFQRRLHPDRFAARSAKEKLYSQQQATALNEAHETLKEPLKRAVYLLKLAGAKIDMDGASTTSDPELLMAAMEAREALAMAETAEEADAVVARTEGDIALCLDDLSRAFAEAKLDGAQKLSIKLKYLLRLSDEARGRRARIARG
jgi:molecular chaperone HscB